MPRLPRRLAVAAGSFALVVLLALISGCGNKVIGIPPEPPPPTAPPANSDVAAVQRLVWCWNNRDTTGLQDLFTADYEYAQPDTIPDLPSWFREQELTFSRHLFVDGTGVMPPTTHITLDVDSAVVVRPDSRPGRDPNWHREVSLTMAVGARTTTTDFYFTSRARFFVTRGDSVKIPQVLKDAGYQPDSTRWWIDRWEDETDGVLSTSAAQGSRMTLALLRILYLPAPPRASRAAF